MKRNGKSRSLGIGIKWGLFLWLTAFTVIILLILWLCQVVFLEDIYRTIKTAEIKSAANELVDDVDDTDMLSEAAESISNKKDVCILVLKMVAPRRAVKLASCDAVKNCAIHNMSQSGYFTLYDSAYECGGKFLQHYRYDSRQGKYIAIEAGNAAGDPESIIYSVIVRGSDGADVLLIFNSVVSPVAATVKTLNYLLIAVSVVMLGLALLLAAIVSRQISKPIISISRSASMLGNGEYNAEFRSGSAFREINELSDTLNYAATELSKVDGLRRELIANTSHDLRTPLTMITGYAEVMRDIPGENTPENAQVIIDESKRLSSLVNDMLDISKLESGNQTVNPELFSITENIRSGLERYNQLKERDGYRIDFHADRNVLVFTDKSKLLQAFFNIVNNAITYTGEDKYVSVTQSVYFDRDTNVPWVRIAVSDTGDGIPQDMLPLIWDRYYKIDAGHRRAAQGTGLGLSIVNKLMSLLGGRCGVESKVGVGSTFMIELPAYAGQGDGDNCSVAYQNGPI